MAMARINSNSSSRAVPLAIAIPLFAFAMPAFAEDAAPPSTEVATAQPGTELATVPEPAESTPTAAPALVDTAPQAEEPPAARYPRSVIARPLTLPSKVAMIGADATANHDFTVMGAAPILGYGITDKLEVQVPYVFSTRELEARGSVGVDVGYAILRGALDGKLEAIARVRGGYNTLDSVATPLMIGVHAQYNITPKIAVISGVPGSQQFCITLADDAEMAKPVYVQLPIGVGVQATDELYFQLDTRILSLGVHESAHALIARDISPLSLTAVYNVINALDVQAAIATDFNTGASDALSFLVGARYYAGQL